MEVGLSINFLRLSVFYLRLTFAYFWGNRALNQLLPSTHHSTVWGSRIIIEALYFSRCFSSFSITPKLIVLTLCRASDKMALARSRVRASPASVQPTSDRSERVSSTMPWKAELNWKSSFHFKTELLTASGTISECQQKSFSVCWNSGTSLL